MYVISSAFPTRPGGLGLWETHKTTRWAGSPRSPDLLHRISAYLLFLNSSSQPTLVSVDKTLTRFIYMMDCSNACTEVSQTPDSQRFYRLLEASKIVWQLVSRQTCSFAVVGLQTRPALPREKRRFTYVIQARYGGDRMLVGIPLPDEIDGRRLSVEERAMLLNHRRCDTHLILMWSVFKALLKGMSLYRSYYSREADMLIPCRAYPRRQM